MELEGLDGLEGFVGFEGLEGFVDVVGDGGVMMNTRAEQKHSRNCHREGAIGDRGDLPD